jgi:hypothetical protein
MECDADFTPSPEQSLEDRAKLITGFRSRVQSHFNRKTRETGEVDTGNELDRKAVQPMRNAYIPGQGERKAARFTGVDEPNKAVDIDPDDITGPNKEAKLRSLSILVYDPSTEKAHSWTYDILATEGRKGEEFTPEGGSDCGCPDSCTCCKCCEEDKDKDKNDCDDRDYPAAPVNTEDRTYPASKGTGSGHGDTGGAGGGGGDDDRRYPAKKFGCF